jgi:type VII secretion protein EccB
MPSKRDQLHAYRYNLDRLAAAIVRAEPEARERPMARATTGTIIGIALAMVAAVAVAAFGLTSRGGNTAWRKPGSIIIDRDTGTRYVYLSGLLLPTLNYTSALLAVGGQSHASIQEVSAGSLRNVPRGRPIGIADAPDDLPAPKTLSSSPWSVCATTVQSSDGTQQRALIVDLSMPPTTATVPSSEAALVAADNGLEYLIWDGARYQVANSSVLVGLGFARVAAVPVRQAWLNAVDSGPELLAQVPDQLGTQGPVVGTRHTRVGQVLQTSLAAGGQASYLVTPNGLEALSETETALILADPRTRVAYAGQNVMAIPVSTSDVAVAVHLTTASGDASYPPSLPRPIDANLLLDRSLCAEISFSSAGPRTQLTTVASKDLPQPTSEQPANVDAADVVTVQPGGGALLAGQAAPGVDTGARYMLTDLGVKFPVPTNDVASELGYSGVTPIPVPTTLLNLIPSGPVLDPSAALTEQSVGR